jgi:hypothetical protein
VTNITVWKLLRRDLGLDREQAALALHELVVALLTQAAPENEGK